MENSTGLNPTGRAKSNTRWSVVHDINFSLRPAEKYLDYIVTAETGLVEIELDVRISVVKMDYSGKSEI